MNDLSCLLSQYQLRSPFIIELNNVDEEKVYNYFDNKNVGAIILPSVTEEILIKEKKVVESISQLHFNTINNNSHIIPQYLSLIKEIKSKIDIPIIARIDIYSAENCLLFCELLEKAGVDIIDLNIFFFPDDKEFRSYDYEKIFFEIAAKVTYSTGIPVFIRHPLNFTHIINSVDQLFYRGVQGFILFPCPPVIDIDINNLEFSKGTSFNLDFLNQYSLNWLAVLSCHIPRADYIQYIHSPITPESIIKSLLIGSKGFIINENNIAILELCINMIYEWMNMHGFSKIEHFQGQINYDDTKAIIQELREIQIKPRLVTKNEMK